MKEEYYEIMVGEENLVLNGEKFKTEEKAIEYCKAYSIPKIVLRKTTITREIIKPGN